MNFSHDESEQVRQLKRQSAQDRIVISQLEQAKVKAETAFADEQRRIRALQSHVDETAARLDAAERREDEVRRDRDQLKVANANLEATSRRASEQVQQRERNRRIDDATRDVALGRRERELLDDNAKLEQANAKLEAQLREAQNAASQAQSGPSSYASASSSRLQALENENRQLKADMDRIHSNASLESPGAMRSMRSRRSSGINVAGTDEQQLREVNAELSKQIEVAEAKASKAEHEALKVSNERLASERKSQSRIETLTSERDDLKDEVKLREDHINDLERNLSAIETLFSEGRSADGDVWDGDIEARVRKMMVKASDADTARKILSTISPSEEHSRRKSEGSAPKLAEMATRAVKAHAEMDARLKKGDAQLDRVNAEMESMRAQLAVLETTTKTLERREKEMALAKRRLKKLSSILRKALPTSAGLVDVLGANACDASVSMVNPDETTIGDITAGLRGFEADMIDELEQLHMFVEELDNRLEFNRVENELRESNAIVERNELQSSLAKLEEKVAEDERIHSLTLQSHQAEIVQLQSELDHRIAAHEQELIGAKKAHDLVAQQLNKRVDDLQSERDGLQREHQEAILEASERLEAHLAVSSQTSTHLHGLLDRYQAALQQETEQWIVFSDEHANDVRDASSRIHTQSCAMLAAHDHAKKQLVEVNLEVQTLQGEVEVLHNNVEVLQARVGRRDKELSACKIELEQERTNCRLAEDALKEYVSNRETDLTVLSNAGGDRDRTSIELQTELEASVERLEEELEAVQKELSEMTTKHMDLTTKLAAAARAQEDALAKVDVLKEESKHTRAQHEADTVSLSKTIDELTQEIAVFEEKISSLGQSNQTLEMQVTDERNARERAEAMLQEAHTANEEECQRTSDLARKIAEMESERDEMQAECSMLRTRQEQLIEQVERFAADAEQEKEEAGVAQGSKHDAETDSLRAEIESLREELRVKVEAVDELETQLSSAYGEASEARDDANERTRIIERLEADVERMTNALETNHSGRDRVFELEEAIANYEEELNLKQTALHDALAKQADLLGQGSLVQSKFAEAQSSARVLQEQLTDKEGEIENLRQELAMSNGNIEAAQKERDELQAESKEAFSRLLAAETNVSHLQEQLSMQKQDQGQSSRVQELEESLSSLSGTVERLEQELAMKAQECEDADDKELALRKDNKRLLARMSQMQARLDKLLLLQQKQTAAIVPSAASRSTAPAAERSAGNKLGSVQNGHVSLKTTRPIAESPPKQQSMTRKRRTRDEDEEQDEAEDAARSPPSDDVPSQQNAAERALVYAPEPTALTTATPVVGNGVHGHHKTTTRTPNVPIRRLAPSSHEKVSAKPDATSSGRLTTKMSTSSTESTKEQRDPFNVVNDASSSGVGNGLATHTPATSALNRSTGSATNGSSKPSDLVALRLQQKLAETAGTGSSVSTTTASTAARLKDRTNKPREVHAAVGGATKKPLPSGHTAAAALGNNNFMAKLNRYRATPGPGASAATTNPTNGAALAINTPSTTTTGTAQSIVR